MLNNMTVRRAVTRLTQKKINAYIPSGNQEGVILVVGFNHGIRALWTNPENSLRCRVTRANGEVIEEFTIFGNTGSMNSIDLFLQIYDHTVKVQLALAFVRNLSIQLTTKEMEVVRNNREDDGDAVCSSHDFCDANMVMLDAFHQVGLSNPLDFPPDSENHDRSLELWNIAWDYAKKNIRFTL